MKKSANKNNKLKEFFKPTKKKGIIFIIYFSIFLLLSSLSSSEAPPTYFLVVGWIIFNPLIPLFILLGPFPFDLTISLLTGAIYQYLVISFMFYSYNKLKGQACW